MTAFVVLPATMHNLRMFFLVVFMLNFREGLFRDHDNRGHYEDCSYGFCEHVKHYPEKHITAMLKKNKALHTFFGNVIKPLEIISTASRLGGDDPEPFCKTIDKTVAPKWMKDVEGQNRTIVNAEDFVQAVTFQTCIVGQGCFAGESQDRKTQCLQSFTNLKLLTYNVEENIVEYRIFRIPSTCVCAYV